MRGLRACVRISGLGTGAARAREHAESSYSQRLAPAITRGPTRPEGEEGEQAGPLSLFSLFLLGSQLPQTPE